MYETERRLKAENESLRVTKREMFGVSISGSRSRRSGKPRKKVASTFREEFVGIRLQVEWRLSTWRGSAFAKLEHVGEGYVRNWTNRGELVNKLGIVVGEGKIIVPLPPPVIAMSRNFVGPSIDCGEDALRQMMEDQRKRKH